jgi:DNA-binding MarR family transcriptional regulator
MEDGEVPVDKEDLQTLRLMDEIDRNGIHSQRELSQRLNISLGLVNTFLKRLVNKGYFKVTTMPRNRVKYFLTPEGLARKAKLTAEYLRYSIHFYRDIKDLLLEKFGEMERNQVKSVLFFGAGEVADLAYLYLQMTSIRLAGIVDESKKGRTFFGHEIAGLEGFRQTDWDIILVTQPDRIEKTIDVLAEAGVDRNRIATI